MRARLFLLAHGRSGDKGDMANIGVIVRREGWYEFLSRELTAERVQGFLGTLARGEVERHELPNLSALNFLVHEALGGGSAISLRLDAQGKTYAQALFRMPLDVPPELAAEVRAHWGGRLPADCIIDNAPGAIDDAPAAEDRP
jgi:hypothetical protein